MKIQHQFISITSVVALVLVLNLYTHESNAAVTVSAVERASIVEGSGTATITVYGGVSGDTSRCNSVASDSLCDNCRLLSTETVPNADPDLYLRACNNRRVHPDLQLIVSLSSDAIDGRATITNSDGNTALAPVSAPLNLTKGTTGQLVLRWGDLCSRVISLDTNSGGEGATQCAPVNGHASASLRVGISSDGDDLLNAATDEYRTMTVIVRGTAGVSLATDCDDVATDSRICYFEMGPGDEKAVVRTLQKPDGNSFPTGTNTTYKFLRFLFDAQGFNFVHLGSSYVDLPVEAADTTTFNVSPRRIEGLVNDQSYYFKIAAVDAAGNVGLYNGKDTDTDCQFSVNPADTTCRVVTPSEVVGVLDKTNCFIATAAYGTPFATELNVLRDFRDQVLMTTAAGRALVRGYYAASPTLAAFILQNDTLRDLTRKALIPFVWFAGISLSIGASAMLWFLISIAIAMTAVVHIVATRPRKIGSAKQESRTDSRDRSGWLPVIIALTIGAANIQPAAAQVEALEDTSSTPIEALEDDTPPPPEYPYPGSTEPTVKPPTAAKKPGKSVNGSKFSDTPTPTKSNGWGEKPKKINEDGDYIYDRLSDTSNRQYGKPKEIKFSGTPGREAPSTISQEGEFTYPVAVSEFTGAGGLRFGMMSPPNIINGSNGLAFKDIYGSAEIPALLFEYEYPLTQAIGRIGIKGETGFIATSAKGRFKNPARAGEVPEERFTFLMVPLQATVIYRFQFADSQWVVPFVEGGGGYYGIVELRDDSKAPKFGGSPVAVAAGGVNILLDWLDRQAVRQLDADYGINHVWLSLQYRQIIGLKEDLKVSSNLITAGFTFDF
jgi:hypothetical protein